MNQSSVLIVSDDIEFSRSIVARWQAERHVPEITLIASGVCHAGTAAGYQLVILGPVRAGSPFAILTSLKVPTSSVVIYVAEDQKDVALLRAEYPCVLVVPRQDGWAGTLILISNEALRRTEAAGRAQRAERLALESQGQASLGRYMLEMRPSVNNALTSVLGNADLLLLEPSHLSEESHDQIQTIHTMALRLNEIMQRFSSLAAEMRACEKDSQAETEVVSHRLDAG
ncbi:MAG: hypothetical protein ACREDR_28700 [Blastocatellia bacterium]